VIVVVIKRQKENPEYSLGKRPDTRKKPHVTYVALKVYIILN
jgi:hypothetical protein